MGGMQNNVTVLDSVDIKTTVKSGEKVDAKFQYTAISDDAQITVTLNPADKFTVTPDSVKAPKDQHSTEETLTFTREDGAPSTCVATFTLGIFSEKIVQIEVKP